MFRVWHPQLQQAVTLLTLFSLGEYAGYMHLGWRDALAVLAWAGVVEHLFWWARRQEIRFVSYSAFSTAIGVMLMLAASAVWMYAAVITLALAQKHWLQVDHRHFFNPSNFALIVGMVLFYHQTHIVLGQLGDTPWLRWIVVILAGGILLRVDRWMIPLGFTVSYLVLEYLWVVTWDPVMTFEDVYRRFYAVSFVVFVAFMLTDPRTTPARKNRQALFGVVIAVSAAGMDRLYGFRVQHLFLVLFVLSPLVPWIEAGHGRKRKMVLPSLGLFLLALVVAVFLENQPPYYFDMEG